MIEPRAIARLAQTSTFRIKKKSEGNTHMSIATGRQATVSLEIGGREITFETGKLAKQADGAVVVRSGDTMILATAVGRQEARPDADFFPLTIDVEERMYAAGKIPGGFFKREGKASERATLTARMIDRPIRPLWPKGFRNEVQVICTVLSADMIHGHDVLCINGASAALAISPLPFLGPVGAVRIARIDGELVVNPTLQEADEDSDLDLIVVGTRDALTMIEAGADQIPEETMLLAFELAHTEIKRICDVDRRSARAGRQAEVGRSRTDGGARGVTRRRDLAAHPGAGPQGGRLDRRRDRGGGLPRRSRSTRPRTTWCARCRSRRASRSCSTSSASSPSKAPSASSSRATLRELTDAEQDSKYLKSRKRGILYDRIIEGVAPALPVCRRGFRRKDATTKSWLKKAADAVYKDIVRKKIAVDKRRPDGRGTEEIRPINVEVGFAPRTHGSGLFTRGETQILTLCTLGTAKEGQRIDDLSLEQDRRYMHHYNFPPYSVGETGFMRGPKRRDIGHGALAQRALAGRDPEHRGLPVHDPPRLGDARVERLVVDGIGLRLDDVDDGRRRADQGAGLRASRWASSRRATTTSS